MPEIGGGLFTEGIGASLVGTSVTGNSAGLLGGGIFNGLQLSLRGARLTGNTAAAAGGGIANNGSLSVTGGLVAGNTVSADDGTGGGIFTDDVLSALTNVTVRGNTAASGVRLAFTLA